MPDRSLRLALYAGVCLRHDAISNSLRLKLGLIEAWQGAGFPVEATAFVHATDYDDRRILELDSAAALFRSQEFRTADVHVFEFGIHYPLFDAVFLLPQGAPSLAVYHNITPPELADDAKVRAVLERSLKQRHNLSAVARVACVSRYSFDELLAHRFPAERLSVLPLPPMQRPVHPAVSRRGDRRGQVELLYVGRLVQAKGVLDLLAAAAILEARGERRFRLTIAGNPSLSSPAVVNEVEARCSTDGGERLRLVAAPDDDRLTDLYDTSDVLVMPSYHEGYCVPVLEALAADCAVVAYDNSNLPCILGGLGTLVPTGDVVALADALAEHVDRVVTARAAGRGLLLPSAEGDLEMTEWRRRVALHLERHSVEAFEAGFAAVLASVLEECGRPQPTWLAGIAGVLPAGVSS
jgi:glycosyltransferase involved in cell wall biosynthesis